MSPRRSKRLRVAAAVAAVLAGAIGFLWAIVGEGGLFLMRFQEDADGFAPAYEAEETALALRGPRRPRSSPTSSSTWSSRRTMQPRRRHCRRIGAWPGSGPGCSGSESHVLLVPLDDVQKQ